MIRVIGDLLIDNTITGSVHRVSPEAPTPVVLVENEKQTLGGAGNVFMNCLSLNGAATLHAVVEEPKQNQWTEPGWGALRRIPCDDSISGSVYQVQDKDYTTPVKNRIVVDGQQLLRFDFETSNTLVSDQAADELLADFASKIGCGDVIVVSDYAKGLFNAPRAQHLLSIANRYSVPVLVDAKPSQLKYWAGATICTPNMDEAIAVAVAAGALEVPKSFTSANEKGAAAIVSAGYIVDTYRMGCVVLTMGALGAAIVRPLVDYSQKVAIYKARAQRVYDVTGAGDSFMAALAVGISNGWSHEVATQRAVTAGSLAVQQHGVVCVSETDWDDACRAELGAAGKLLADDEVVKFAALQRSANRRIALTNGCFDVLHVGHMQLLETAADQNAVLLVAVDSDENVRRLKGNDRPMTPQHLRMLQIAALPFVGRVVLFNGSILDLIKRVNPDVLIKGGDYTEEQIIGADYVKETGGQVVIVPSVEGISTTKWANMQ